MSLPLWMARRRWRWTPHWFQQWQHRERVRHLKRTHVPAMFALQEAGFGIKEVWGEPHTPADEILTWIEEQIAATPRPLAKAADLFKIFVIRCTESEWEAAQEEGVDINLPADRLLAEWQGLRATWWWDGRDAVAAAIPPNHDGLYLVVNGLGTAFLAALQPHPNQEGKV